MANAVYPKWKEAIIQASSNSSLTGTVKAALVDTGTYTYSSAHQFFSDLSGVVGTPGAITTHTYTNGTFDGDDVTYTSVTGASVEALVLYIDTGTAGTSRLVLYLDTSQTGLPVTPNGGNITVTWNASGIFTVSDREAKENIRKVGSLGPANVYEYNYRGRKERQLGFMAQEVEQFAPHAVRQIGGRKRVDYGATINAALMIAA